MTPPTQADHFLFKELRDAYYNDSTVHRCLSSNQSLYDVINALVQDKRMLMAELERLHGIAPRKIRLPDGKIMVWRCPEHLIPNLK